MIQRCHNERHREWYLYGARGIAVCKEWRENFVRFFESVGERPDGMSLDRIDNERGYEPGNCRWTDQKTQSRNKRSNRLLTLDGRTQCVSDWSQEVGIARCNIYKRLDAGWTVQDALTNSTQGYQRRTGSCAECSRPILARGLCSMHYQRRS